MSIRKSFVLAISNIMYDKMRSFLTMLGIIVGVAAVIILISLMNGMTGMITDTFEEIGTKTLTVSVQDRGGNRRITEEDMYKLRDENRELLGGVSPTVSISRATVKVPGSPDSITTNITGAGEEYAEIKQLNVSQGRFLNYMDMNTNSKACVIGTYIQKELFNSEPAVGGKIKINGMVYNVVGVLEEKAESSSTGADNVIIIPYTTASRIASTSYIGSYSLTAASDEVVSAAKEFLEAELLKKIGDDEYFSVSSMGEILDMATEMMDTMKMLLVCIAGISLLVGGIGIMNIMLVSVTERTREIGIRKSLGAKSGAIMSQFVIEAGTVSALGGVIGIVLGSAIAVFAGNLLGLTATPSLGAIALSFGVSVGIGVAFGYLPAKNAAKLNPIDALRHD